MFWPDLATYHYTKENLAFLEENGIAYVKIEENPPNAPQIRPIENYWWILKMKVYEGNFCINFTIFFYEFAFLQFFLFLRF